MKRNRWIIIFLLIMPLFAFILSCSYTAPYRLVEPIPKDTKTVLVTLSAVESKPGQRRAFFDDTKRVLADLPNQNGLLGYSFRFQVIGRRAWTMTTWKDEASRDAFAVSPIHREAVKNSRVTSENMRFISKEIAVSDLPMKWAEALKLLEVADAYGR